MKGIFISYRREDSAGYAGRLYDRLAAHFGADRVFMDVEGIEPGVDFVDAIERAVASCEVLIVIIGNEWLAANSAGKRRLDDPKDFVRIETAAALARGIRVVPVLVEDAAMPRGEDLPADLTPLVRRQALELSHKQWDATSGELIRTLEKILNVKKARSEGVAAAPESPSTPQGEPSPNVDAQSAVAGAGFGRRYAWMGAAAVLVIAAVALLLTQPWHKIDKAPPPRPGHLVVSPGKMEFKDQPLRVAGPPSSITLTNDGDAPLRVNAAKLEGTVGDFALSDDQCTGRTLAPATSCSLKITFNAQGTGARTALLTFPSEPANPVVVNLEGRGAAPTVAEIAPPVEKPTQLPPPQPAPIPQVKPEPPVAPPKILNFEAKVADGKVELCYGVENAAGATITPSPGAVKSGPKQCVPVAPDGRRTYTLTARNAAGTAVTRALTVEVPTTPAPPAEVATAPKMPTPEPTPQPPPPAVAVASSALPRVGDTWEYRSRSMWKNVEPRIYTHQATGVSEREVRETMTYAGSASDAKSFGPDTRFVERRGNGYYYVEFNPFIQALGVLSAGTAWKSLAYPAADPFFGNWSTHGRAVDWDSVTVPAGTFKAMRVEINSNRAPTGSVSMRASEPVRILQVIWYAPDAKRAVKAVRTVYSTSGIRLDEDTYELVKYRLQ